MDREGCKTYNPLCLTLVFLFGSIIGSLIAHPEDSVYRTSIVIIVSTVAFHITHLNPKQLLRRLFNKGF